MAPFFPTALLACFLSPWQPQQLSISRTAHLARISHAAPTIPTTLQLSSTTANAANAIDSDLLVVIREGIVEQGFELSAWELAIDALLNQFPTDDTASLTREQAEWALAQAFGWRSWAKASKFVKKFQKIFLPTPEEIEAAISWSTQGPLALSTSTLLQAHPQLYLKQPQAKFVKKFQKIFLPTPEEIEAAISWSTQGPLALSTSTLLQAVQTHPQLYLKQPQASYQKCVDTVPAGNLKDTLHELIAQDPAVLGNTFNCAMGDDGCRSECGNCWVSYKIKNNID
eukprot:CAMPEP_0172471380 /NCGR_PEP_ID=MMETSP1065-20121228/67788_1 /TAXON_ID=265537 /ORGANISM="Amphiprora paludosa, Strain CCMP125" /LENGTH=283 /DNA_ID=CAMNT_0013229475 /DNA_START=29 /DNA_END=880 /DNA_ORIENTATION=-